MINDELFAKWHPIIRNCLKGYIATHPSLYSSFEDLYQECFAACLRIRRNNPNFTPSYLRIQDIIRRYLMTTKMFTVHDVNNISSVEVGKEIDSVSNRLQDIGEFVGAEDKSSLQTYNDIDTLVDWDHFCSVQDERDSQILRMRYQGMSFPKIAEELGVSLMAVHKRVKKLNTKYHEWLEAS